MRYMKVTIVSFFFMALLGLFVSYGSAESPTGVVLLPFDVEHSGPYGVLKDGLRTMLSSRLSAIDGVVLLENSLTTEEHEGFLTLSQEKRKGIFKKLATDYIGVGKILAQDTVFLLQMNFYTMGSEQPMSLSMHADNEQQIIDGIERLSERIVKKLLGRESPAPQRVTSQNVSGVGAFGTEHPDRKYKRDKVYGIATVGEESKYEMVQGDLAWSKSALPHGLVSMTVIDWDGDGVDEIFVASVDDLRVFHYERGTLQQLGIQEFKSQLDIHAVNVADLDGDGKMEIYLSAMLNDEIQFASSVLVWDLDNGFRRIMQNIPWAIRPIYLPGEGMVLAGQKENLGRMEDNFLQPDIFALKMDEKKKRYAKGKQLSLPEGVNLFDFVFADIDGDGPYEKVAITRDMKLANYDEENRPIWLSEEDYGGGLTHLGKWWKHRQGTSRSTGGGDNEGFLDLSYVPTRLIAVDVNKDGKTDIISGKNVLSSYKWLSNSRSFSDGNVVCMSWDGSKMVELWGTDRLGGHVTDYHIVSDKLSNSSNIPDKNSSAKIRLKLYVGQVPNDSFANLFAISGKETNLLTYSFNIIEKSKSYSEEEK